MKFRKKVRPLLEPEENSTDKFFKELKFKETRLKERLNLFYDTKLASDKLHDKTLKSAQMDVVKIISFEAYCESSPQAIPQMYTLWKKPKACILWSSTIGKC